MEASATSTCQDLHEATIVKQGTTQLGETVNKTNGTIDE